MYRISIFLIGCLLSGISPGACQPGVSAAKADTQVVRNLLEQGQRYYFSQPDSSLFYSLQALDLAR
ncbi:MAG: hypothetical protein MUE58_08465, partial [Chitinophagaceae bacterium]|nr:hypothetical protein [Chitinophagaceae bacterium]